MVSLRRRRLLGYTTGLVPQYIDAEGVAHFGTPPTNQQVVELPVPYYFDNEGVAQISTRPTNQINAPPIPSAETRIDQIPNSPAGPNLVANMLVSSSLNDKNGQENDNPSPVQQENPKLKTRKHRHEEEEVVSLRGVYYKYMRWQAAIKVNSKQFHLGTYPTQDDACRIYDKAAFVIGRTPNYEVPNEDQEELKKMNWDEFIKKNKADLRVKRKSSNKTSQGAEVGSSSWMAEPK